MTTKELRLACDRIAHTLAATRPWLCGYDHVGGFARVWPEDDGRLVAVLISDAFKDRSQIDKVEMAWERVNATLGTADALLVKRVLAYTQDEAEDRRAVADWQREAEIWVDSDGK